MCKINLLIISNSLKRNKSIIKKVKDEASSLAGDNVQVVVKAVDPLFLNDITPKNYDLVVIDEAIMVKGCSKNILGSGVPILSWDIKPLSKNSADTISKVVKSVVENGLLCEHIIKTTIDIEQTHQMLTDGAMVTGDSRSTIASKLYSCHVGNSDGF